MVTIIDFSSQKAYKSRGATVSAENCSVLPMFGLNNGGISRLMGEKVDQYVYISYSYRSSILSYDKLWELKNGCIWPKPMVSYTCNNIAI